METRYLFWLRLPFSLSFSNFQSFPFDLHLRYLHFTRLKSRFLQVSLFILHFELVLPNCSTHSIAMCVSTFNVLQPLDLLNALLSSLSYMVYFNPWCFVQCFRLSPFLLFKGAFSIYYYFTFSKIASFPYYACKYFLGFTCS